jgi:Asp-tRNA(Asn)/Glu-tRNA(Gln) amidotransferase A subunit family amidase
MDEHRDIERDLAARLDAIARAEPQLRAFAHLDAAAALARARGPLHGLAVGLKDVFDTAAQPTAYGSPMYAGHRPAVDAAVVSLLEAAGAVIVGKTVTTEFATYEPGPTRHPQDPARTPGGSSSGSAVAVAAGLLPLALGTQTAGSIVRPAAFCGVVGFKPSFGRVPRAGMKLVSESLDTVGGFAVSVRGAGRLAAVLTGDATLAAAAAPVRGAAPPRVALFAHPQAAAASADVQRLLQRAQHWLAAQGAGGAPLAAPAWFAEAQRLQPGLAAREGWAALAAERARDAAAAPGAPRLSERLRAMLAEGAAIDGAGHAAQLAALQRLRGGAAALFEGCDVLLAPSALGVAPPREEGTGDPVFCRAFTLLGLPCLHLPLGRGEHGLPLGLQLVGPPQGDAALLRAAAWFEAAWAASSPEDPSPPDKPASSAA